jgi:ubiquinone biosynthesis protein COQ9
MEQEREIEFRNILNKLSENLPNVEYENGDLSDIGNEIGYQLGSIVENITEDEIKLFIIGFKHGVSLTNGTH